MGRNEGFVYGELKNWKEWLDVVWMQRLEFHEILIFAFPKGSKWIFHNFSALWNSFANLRGILDD